MMWSVYRQRLAARAEATVAKGHVAHLLIGIWRDAAIWVVPVALVGLVCALFKVLWPKSLLLLLPAMAVAFSGSIATFRGCIYVPSVTVGKAANHPLRTLRGLS